MKTFDPSLPVTITNWPKGLKMPPLRRQDPKPEKPAKPVPVSSSREADSSAPWWS